MNVRFLNALFVTFLMVHAAASLSGANTRWSTLTPKDEGFAIEVPGEPQPTAKPGHYVYTSGLWSFIIQSDPVSPTIRELVENGQHRMIATYLERIRDGMIDGAKATRRSSVSTDIDGYPSIQFSLDGALEHIKLEGTNRLVLTDQRMYILVTIGPKGPSPNADVQRFLDSFRLVGIKPASARTRTRATAPPASMLTTKLAGPMLAVARLVTEAKLSPKIDQVLQNIPAAEHLGTRWNSSHAAWQQARTAITSRIDRLADFYESSGAFERDLDAELVRLAPRSAADALDAVLSGAAGPAILRSTASIQFVVMVMADDPNGPKAGERAWADTTTALQKLFDQRTGAAMPRDDGTHTAEVGQFLSSDASRVFSNLWSSMLGKATVELEGAINLLLFDDREAIMREIETAIASVK